MDLIYKIYSVWLYPNDTLFKDVCLFYTSKDNQYYIKNKPFLVKDFLALEENTKTKGYEIKYKIYDLYWNETKSGINILDWNYVWVFDKDDSPKSILRIFEYKEQRIESIRNLNLIKLGI